MIQAFLTGLGTGFSLIIAIGAQNAFVLRQGIRREHVFVVALICALSDAVLMLLGMLGIGAVIERAPMVLTIVLWGGVAFLLWYAWGAARRALRPGALMLDEKMSDSRGDSRGTLRRVVLSCLAITLLNPHVYLDTMVLMGSIGASQGELRWWFIAGGITASVTWFFSLAYGARALTPLFAQPRAWRVLDAVIAVVMVMIALKLAASALGISFP